MNMIEQAKEISVIKPRAGASITSKYVSLKHCKEAYIFVHINQANAATVAITVEEAKDKDGDDSQAIANNTEIWVNQDTDTSDAMVRQDDGKAFTTSAATKTKLVAFRIDPARISEGFTHVCVKTAASNAANITSAHVVLTGLKYKQAIPPTDIT